MFEQFVLECQPKSKSSHKKIVFVSPVKLFQLYNLNTLK